MRMLTGVQSPRKFSVLGSNVPLPSARVISRTVHPDVISSTDLTILVMQWGQFMDHEMVSTPLPIGKSDLFPYPDPIRLGWERERQTDRQTDRQRQRQSQRQRETETGRQTDRQKEGRRERQKQTYRQADRGTDRQTFRQRQRKGDNEGDDEDL